MTDLWVFGYGSLMWRPGFDFEESVRAKIFGAHRSLCVLSHTHRGTPQSPGLVLGLDRGGSCLGLAFRVAEENGESVIGYLRERELDNRVYVEARRRVRTENVLEVDALVYVADRKHPQYVGDMGREEALAIVRSSHGHSGPNRDYVVNTALHLEKLGIRDPYLDWLASRLR
ncbi:MAG: gamma-glutamylcyclotransferase [Alphaproteobacteria bacterium]